MARISVWVKPGSRKDGVEWDPWRECWVVSCREPPAGGRANRAVAALMADWLGCPRQSVRWVMAGTSRSKVLLIDGMAETDIQCRLESQSRGRS